jgi:NAD(P)H-dependent FMN reductase
LIRSVDSSHSGDVKPDDQPARKAHPGAGSWQLFHLERRFEPIYRAAMDTPAEYVVVSASLREASLSRALANELVAYYRESKLNSQLLDLRQVELPFCDADAAYGHPNVETCQALLNSARVIIVATPIYNFDVNAAAKNLVELTGDAWENKVVGFLCAAGGASSYMSVMGLANSLMLDFRSVIIPRFVYATRHDFADGLHLRDEVRARVHELGEASRRIRVG